MEEPTETEPHATRLARWFQASPAEIIGLAVLVLGALAVTATLWLQANQRPGDLPNEASDVGSAVDGDADVDGPAPGADDPPGAPGGGHDADSSYGSGHGDGETAGDAPGAGSADGNGGHGGYDGDHGGDGPDAPGAAAPSTGPVDVEVAVHVTGAVERPGLVVLPGGGRVADAVEAAGGLTGEARTELINLARPLSDGEHVHVPVDGEDPPVLAAPPTGPAPDPASPPGGGAGEGDGTGGGDPAAPGAPIDLNHASATELETLPGIGPARAQAIVTHREEHGPFATAGDIRAVSGIGEAIFQGLADLVTTG